MAVDLDSRKPALLAESLLDELESDGPAEISWHANKRLTLQRIASVENIPAEHAGLKTVVATGGARGVTFEILRHMAEQDPVRLLSWPFVGVSVHEVNLRTQCKRAKGSS